VVGHGQVEAEQAEDGADQALGRARGQAEHRPQRQRRQDRQRRVVRLAARRGAGLGAPGGDRRVGGPDRQAATLAQGSVVLGPVGHPVPLLGDRMTASGVGLERHGGIQGFRIGADLFPYPTASTNPRSMQQGEYP
jgi:hypothetical protein